MPRKKNTIKAFGSKKRTKSRGLSTGRKKKNLNAVEVNVGVGIASNVNVDPPAIPLGVEIASNVNVDPPAIPHLNKNNNNKFDGNTTASERKLQLLEELVTKDFPTEAINCEEVAMSGYRLINCEFLKELVFSLACPNCKTLGLDITEKKMSSHESRHSFGLGLNSVFEVHCLECNPKTVIFRGETSEKSNSPKSINSINLRMVAAARNSGIGYAKFKRFFGNLNLPQPMHLKTYQIISKRVHKASTDAALDVMTKSVVKIKENCKNSDDIVPVAISFDGTWHKRGHSSHFGIGVIIELNTGFVIDYHVNSNYCHGCSIGPKVSDPKFKNWLEKHKTNCQKNFNGSANAMEADAAKVMFSRSILKYKLIYNTMLCDGDSKAHTMIKNVYGDVEVIKEDCVNHIAKRMYTALDTLKKKSKAEGQSLDRKLTKVAMEKITSTYASNLKKYAPDLDAMKRGVYSSLFHMISTDDKPHHTYCPHGENSWCHFNRALSKNEPAEKHHPTFSNEVGEKLLPIYDRLTEPSLLERCSRMKTQNANESFNALIWKRCPKTEFASKNTIETAVAMAVVEFNCGPKGFEKILDNLSIFAGEHQKRLSTDQSTLRVAKSKKAASDLCRSRRKRRKMDVAKQADVWTNKEGQTYQSGSFNN